MTALPEDAPLTRRQARESQQNLTETEGAPEVQPRRRRASTSEPMAAGEIPQPSAPAASAPAAEPSTPAAAPSSQSASSPAPTGGLTRRQLRELERTGSIEQITVPAAAVAPPVVEPAPKVALPPRAPEPVAPPTQKQGKAAKQQAAKAAAAAEAEAKAAAERKQDDDRKASARKEVADRQLAQQAAAERKAADRAAAKAADEAAVAERAAKARSAQVPVPAKAAPAKAAPAVETVVPTGSLFDVSDRDDISEDPASTLSKGFGRDSMLVAALEADAAAAAETGVAFEDLLGSGMATTGQITTSSLIIPVAPAQAEAGATSNSTGEILITGTIDLPRGLGSSGQDPNHFDGAGIDRLIEGDELPASVTAASPVAASKAVSSHGSTRDVVPATTNQSNKLLMSLAIAAAVLAAGVIAVLIIGFLGGAF